MPGRRDDAFLREMAGQLAGWSDPGERLRQALDKDELVLFCQPIAALSGPTRFPMAEVLVRLRAEETAMLPPGEFLPVFEHYRLMPALDRWVVRKVLQHLQGGSKIARVIVEVVRQHDLDDPEFPQAAAAALVSAGVPGASILFEIEESDTLARLKAVQRFAKGVRAVGCGR